AFIASVTDLQAYLAGETIDCNGHPSRLQWLARCRQPKVPLDIAVSGPRMIEFAARIAERVTLAVGADPDRVAWAIDLARNAAADTSALNPEFIDRFAVVGPPDACAARLHELADLGLERFVITGASFRADREHVRTSEQLMTRELLPALRERSNHV